MRADLAQPAVDKLAERQRALLASASGAVEAEQSGWSGLANGALSLWGDDHVALARNNVSLATALGRTVQTLQGMIDRGECETKDSVFVDLLNQTAIDLGDAAGYQKEAAVATTIQLTADATAKQAGEMAANAGGAIVKNMPIWAWVGIAAVAAGALFLISRKVA